MNSHGHAQTQEQAEALEPSTSMWHVGDWVGHCYGLTRAVSSKKKNGLHFEQFKWCTDVLAKAADEQPFDRDSMCPQAN